MNFLKLAAAILLAGTTANAMNIDAKIVKAKKDASRVIVSTNDTQGIRVGEYLSLGTNCELEVVKVPKGRIILDGSLCEETKFLTEGRDVILVNNLEARRQTNKIKRMPNTNTEVMVEPSANSTRTARIKRTVKDEGFVARGFRISSSIARTTTEETDNYYFIQSILRDNALSFSLGYTIIGINSFGFIGDTTYTTYDKSSAENIRMSGSLAYGFGEKVYGYVGTNINFFTGSSGSSDYDNKLGQQFGLGFQINKTLGLNLARVTTRNEFVNYYSETEIRTDATELGMTLTF